MSQPRYAPRRASLKLSLTRAVTSAAALAALAMVCGPTLNPTGDTAGAVVAAAISTPGPAEATDASEPAAPGQWSGPLPIRPSRIAHAKPASGDASPLSVQAVAVGPVGPAGAVGALGIPVMVLRAYHLAADRLKVEQPSCKLPWWLLAGIGRTESGHAESGRLITDGTTRGRILGPRLNGGIVGDAIITDTDHGKHDGDTVYDRAVGPMQFIPTTWAHWGADGNADAKSDPNNIFDATLAAGRYLCADGRDLATAAGLRAAVLSYNHSAPYLATVLAWGAAYRDGVSTLPDSPLPVISDVTKARPPRSSRPPKPTAKPSKLPSAGPTAASSTRPAPSSPASSSAAGSSATATASPTASTGCPSASPSPSGSSSSATVVSATPQTATPQTATPQTAKPTSSATATPSGAAAPSGSATGTATASGSRVQSATAQSTTSGSTTSGSTASPSLSSCAP
ncbi:MAG: hypothetical protein ABI047_14570 [Jatrophihabitantaceae bacterium]